MNDHVHPIMREFLNRAITAQNAVNRIIADAELKAQSDGGRTNIGNTPTCEDCGKPADHCKCED